MDYDMQDGLPSVSPLCMNEGGEVKCGKRV